MRNEFVQESSTAAKRQGLIGVFPNLRRGALRGRWRLCYNNYKHPGRETGERVQHMSYTQGNYPIVAKHNLAKNCYDYTFYAPEMAKLAEAGQFVHIKVNGFFLRRPISICEVDKAAGTLRVVFEIRGNGTEAMAEVRKGDLMDVMGPLGKGFTPLEAGQKVVVIGGGIGVPPMLETAKRYGKNATAILGFRSATAAILTEDFERIGARTILCTDDGTAGRKGFVTDALAELLEQEKPALICACGPHLMLKGIVELANRYQIPCEVSLEERMGCGVGACLVCACKTVKNGEEYFAHVCKDGPVFPAEQVRFD